MKLRGLLLFLAILAAAVFLPPVGEARRVRLRLIDPGGRDLPCPARFAHVEAPPRVQASPVSPLSDFAYAAAAAGPEGCAWALGGILVLVFAVGLWARGLRGALRRTVLACALGVPLCLGLLYASCFLRGRMIRLGPEGVAFTPANFGARTDRGAGLLSPENVVRWHAERGFTVVNVADRDTLAGVEPARRFAREQAAGLLVLTGEELTTSPPLLLVNAGLSAPGETVPPLESLAAQVHAAGGALILEHPWDHVPADRSLEDLLGAGIDGMEIVNGVIHGGRRRLETARAQQRALVGAFDVRYGPHVNAVTLLPQELAATPEGVVTALRRGDTRVLYAVPGGVMSGEEWKAAELGITGAAAGFEALRECPRSRRAIWYVWIGGAAFLWWMTTRPRGEVRGGLGPRAARVLFGVCAALELVLPVAVHWEVRALIGTIPMWLLLGLAGMLAVPLLAATHALARTELSR